MREYVEYHISLFAGENEYYSLMMYPRCSMYGIVTNIWVIYGVNVGKYAIHGAYGIWKNEFHVPVTTNQLSSLWGKSTL